MLPSAVEAVSVGSRLIGAGAPCFIAAEVGLNHDGSVETAHRLIDAAADAGANGVKFQSYRTEDFLADEGLEYEYRVGRRTVRESQYAMFKRCELPPGAHGELVAHCVERGVVFFSTPTSVDGVRELVRDGVQLLKNGSDFLGHLPLVQAMGSSGVPTVLSTGMATLSEVDGAVRAFREAGGHDLVLLHCTSSYPTPSEDVHLRAIPTLALAFGCPVGLSDHTDGVVAAIGAVALGACFLEKHFTLDRSRSGPDHRFSADPAELAELVEAVRTLERSLGRSEIGPAPSESFGREAFRLSCTAARDIAPGEQLRPQDIVFRRPGTGLPPSAAEWLIGRVASGAIAAGAALHPDHLR